MAYLKTIRFCMLWIMLWMSNVSASMPSSKPSEIALQQIPKKISQQTYSHIIIQDFFDDLNNGKIPFEKAFQDKRLRILESDAGVACESLRLLLSFALYHRPFRFEAACKMINVFIRCFPLVRYALEQELAGVGLEVFCGSDVLLKNYQLLFLRALASHYSFGAYLLSCYASNPGSFLSTYLHGDFWKKLMIMVSITCYTPASLSSPFFSYEMFGKKVEELMMLCKASSVHDFFSLIRNPHWLEYEQAIFNDDVEYIKNMSGGGAEFFYKKSVLGYNYLALAAFAGAIRIFDYATLACFFMDTDVLIFSIIGGNDDIIEICLHSRGELNLTEAAQWGILFHKNDLVDKLRKHCDHIAIGDWWDVITYNNWRYFVWFSNREGVVFNERDGYSLLHIAAVAGSSLIGRVLLDQGCDKNAFAEFGRTPLMFAVEHNHVAFLKVLLEYGADVNIINNMTSDSALLYAVREYNPLMVGLLLEHGADVRVKDSNGATPLHILISTAQFFYAWGLGIKQKGVGYGYNIPRLPEALTLQQTYPDFFMRLVSLLLDCGSEVTQGITTPLHMAVDYGFFSLVKLLVDKGVDLNQRDQDGKTPLWYAIKNGHPVVVDFLQKHGAHLGID